ncbi:MAG: C40 family peptidase [Zoogloeaceae bacterium]|nr:C40 family peptidase [Rhodocyclaceae bacterium]MCP5233588.1 C40 family peptidase [Zoogloeaceae bacterium]
MRRADFLEIARAWEGTPYHDQARLRGVGADCIGFVVGAMQEATGRHIAAPMTYGRYAVPAVALQLIADSGEADEIKVADASPGDLLYMAIRRNPQHFALLLPEGWMIHCSEPAGVRVVPYAGWMRERTRHAFRLRFLED